MILVWRWPPSPARRGCGRCGRPSCPKARRCRLPPRPAPGLLDEDVERDIVEDVAGLVDHAVLAVRGVRVERDVGHDADRSASSGRPPRAAPGLWDSALRGRRRISAAARLPEERKDRDAQLQALLASGSSLSTVMRSTPGMEATFSVRDCRRARTPDRSVVAVSTCSRISPARKLVAPHAPHANPELA